MILRAFCLLNVCFIPSFGLGLAYEPGELVVAKVGLELREGSTVIDTVAAGQVLRVLTVRTKNLWVSRGKPGWVEQKQVLRLDEADAVFSSAIQSKPRARDYLARGNVRLAKGNHQGGLQDIRKAMELSGGSDEFLEPLAYAQLASTQLSEAAQTFQRVLAQKPNYAPALMGRGVAYYQLGKDQAALEDLKNAIKLDPKHAFPRRYLGALYYDQSNLDLASKELDVAVSLDAFDPFARKIRGRLHFDLGEYQAALTDFDVALGVDSNDIEALTGHGIVAHAIGKDLRRAKQDFERAVKLETESKDSAYLWSNLGQVQMELGEDASAYQNLTRAIRLDPTLNETRSHRAFLLANSQDANPETLNQAKDDMRTVFNSGEPRSFWDYRALAAVNAALGDFVRAGKYQQLAEEVVRRTGPTRFIEIAVQTKLRYSEGHR